LICCVLLAGYVLRPLRGPLDGTCTGARVDEPRDEVLAGLAPRTGHGCTSFYLDKGSQPVFGTNYDTVRSGEGFVFVNKRGVAKRGWERGITGEVAHWVSRYGSVTFNNTSYEHAWSGMNEAGLVISTMHLPATKMPAPDARPPLIVGQWLQYQLDNFSTVDQVIASDSQIRIRVDDEDHHLVCDRAGDCASIEFIDGKPVYHSGETMPVKALTNTGYAEALAFLNKGHTRSLNTSLDRFVRAAHMMSSYDPETSSSAIAYAFDILAQVGSRRHTQWGIVYDVQDLRVYFRTKSSPQVRCLDLGVLDFSCATPVQMLDINADLSGNVADDLQPYSHEAALTQLWWFVQEADLGDTYAESEAYIAHLEGYTCMEEGGFLTPSQDEPSPGSGTCADHIPPLSERGIGALWLVGFAGTALVAYVVCRLYRAKKR
jgi:penicillin V acylase-like amidase (Ntn superfamily)